MQPPSPHQRRSPSPSPVGGKRTGDRTSRSPSPVGRKRTGDRTSRSPSPVPRKRTDNRTSRSPSPVPRKRTDNRTSRSPSPVRRKRTGDRTSRSPSPDRRTRPRPRPRPSPRTGDLTSRRNPSPDMRAQKHSKPLLYWAIASFIGRCELHTLAEDFVACGERMGFKICPPLVFQENTNQYLTCPADIRVNEMCTRIMRCSPDFILCIVDEYSDIREIWRKELSKLQIDTHCISLHDTNRQGFLERVLVEIHSEPDEPIVEDDDEDDDDEEDDDKDEDDAEGGSNRGGKVFQGISNSS